MKLVRISLFYIYILLIGFFAIGNITLASQDTDVLSLKIVPSVNNQSQVDAYILDQKWQATVSNNKSFWYKYEYNTTELQKNKDLWWQIQWWFINFGTILSFLAYLIRLITNVAIVAGAFFVIRWWYEYALQTFGGKPKTTE